MRAEREVLMQKKNVTIRSNEKNIARWRRVAELDSQTLNTWIVNTLNLEASIMEDYLRMPSFSSRMTRPISEGEEAGGISPDGREEGKSFIYSERSSSMRASSFVSRHFRIASSRIAFAFWNSFLLDRMTAQCFFMFPTW